MSQTTGRWKLGFLLALITALMWGVLPIALKALLRSMDPFTLTWYRFLAAALALGAYLHQRRRLPPLTSLRKRSLLLLLIGSLGLVGNYVLYLVGLFRVTPETAQMVIQLAPMFLLLGGLIFFGEQFEAIQWVGLAVLTGGLMLFFHDHLEELFSARGSYAIGVFIIIAAALVWAVYALAQKRLLTDLASEQILLVIYAAAVLVLLPVVVVQQVANLTSLGWLLLFFSCANTVIAYGCFAEALAHWEASRVSAVLAVTPLVTLTAMYLVGRNFPGFMSAQRITLLSLVGALLVVVGSMLAALGRRRRRAVVPAPME